MSQEADKRLEEAVLRATKDAQAEAQRFVEEAKESRDKAEQEINMLKAAAAKKSRSAMELSALLAKEKLMRKLADRKSKTAPPVLKQLLESTVETDEVAGKLKELSVTEGQMKQVQESLTKAEIEVRVSEDQKTRVCARIPQLLASLVVNICSFVTRFARRSRRRRTSSSPSSPACSPPTNGSSSAPPSAARGRK